MELPDNAAHCNERVHYTIRSQWATPRLWEYCNYHPCRYRHPPRGSTYPDDPALDIRAGDVLGYVHPGRLGILGNHPVLPASSRRNRL